MYLENLCKQTKNACGSLYMTETSVIDKTLREIAKKLVENVEYIKEQNGIDLKSARDKGMTEAFIDRLTLSNKVISSMAEGLIQVANLSSPVGKKEYEYNNIEQGIEIEKIFVPFGVVGMIYESRPNVTIDAFALCFKTKNAVILKGGSDGLYSNKALVEIIKSVLKENGIDENAVNLVEDTSRETTVKLMKMDKYLDLLIPRGSKKLIQSVTENATVPTIETGAGNCHVYVDVYADIEKAVKVIYNAKTQRYGVCNACESLVIHKDILEKVLPKIADSFLEKKIEIRADERAYQVIKDYPYLKKATEDDFYAEYDDAIISVKTVDCICVAIDHINEHSTKHSESIITEDNDRAEKFINLIDSSAVYHNASTRFSDGFVFGLGAEIGISTQKLHARGPMGLNALVTTKYVVKGDGAVRK
ncbi:MAG: glutamate-5-semialdehyde dehydrogenase [Clostridia bacterium]|nr:glutamate-5-semialdehyde dehydrogenase [Clostridia bacterium]